MPKAFAPFGLIPVASFGTHGNQVRAYPLPNGAACPDLGRGSPVKMSGGVLTSAGTGGGPILGVALGFQWIDPTSKRPVVQNYIPADVSSAGILEGESRPVALVNDNPDTIFMMQADASVTAGDMGLNFDVTAATADPNTTYGISTYALDASTRTSAVGTALKLIGIAKVDDNAYGDPFPWVLVKTNGPIMFQVSAA